MMHLDGIDDGQNSNIHPPGPTASSRSIHIAGIISWCGSLTSGRDEWIQSFLSSHSDGKGSSTVGCYFSMWGSIVSASLQSLDQNPWGTLLSSQSQWSNHTLQSHIHLSGPAWEVSRAFICFSSTVFLKSDLLHWYPVPQGTFLYLEVHCAWWGIKVPEPKSLQSLTPLSPS